MNLAGHDLRELTAALRDHAGLLGKRDIQPIARRLLARAGAIQNGDDAAALPDADGYTLLAAEGMLPSFVQAEPSFAGFCAILTNVNDIAAMGGRSRAVVDVFFAGEDAAQSAAVLDGLAAGSELFGVPIVGGHTGQSRQAAYLSAAIVGKAQRLISSFTARPGDVVVACLDTSGAYRGASSNFDAISGRSARDARTRLELLPTLAEAGLVHAGKDVSMAGIVGTLLMLLETSGCAATLDLGALPAPAIANQEALRWLQAFPSFGFLLVTTRSRAAEVIARMRDVGVTSALVAEIEAGNTLDLMYEGQRTRHWDLTQQPLMGFAAQPQPTAAEGPHA
jgi:AIR synthase-related protein